MSLSKNKIVTFRASKNFLTTGCILTVFPTESQLFVLEYVEVGTSKTYLISCTFDSKNC